MHYYPDAHFADKQLLTHVFGSVFHSPQEIAEIALDAQCTRIGLTLLLGRMTAAKGSQFPSPKPWHT